MSGLDQQLCKQCQLPGGDCICEYCPELVSEIHFWILSHHNEFLKPTNTARLMGACLPNVRFFHWARAEPDSELLELLSAPSFRKGLVFPESMAKHSTGGRWQNNESDQSGRKTAFIVIDGTWQQARKIYRKSSYLHRLPLVSLTPGYSSEYDLRRSQHDQQLCTAETAVELLQLQGEESNARQLYNYFRLFCRSYVAARHKHR